MRHRETGSGRGRTNLCDEANPRQQDQHRPRDDSRRARRRRRADGWPREQLVGGVGDADRGRTARCRPLLRVGDRERRGVAVAERELHHRRAGHRRRRQARPEGHATVRRSGKIDSQSAQLAVDQAEASLNSANAQLTSANQQAQTSYAQALLTLKAAKAGVSNAKAGVSTAKANQQMNGKTASMSVTQAQQQLRTDRGKEERDLNQQKLDQAQLAADQQAYDAIGPTVAADQTRWRPPRRSSRPTSSRSTTRRRAPRAPARPLERAEPAQQGSADRDDRLRRPGLGGLHRRPGEGRGRPAGRLERPERRRPEQLELDLPPEGARRRPVRRQPGAEPALRPTRRRRASTRARSPPTRTRSSRTRRRSSPTS